MTKNRMGDLQDHLMAQESDRALLQRFLEWEGDYIRKSPFSA